MSRTPPRTPPLELDERRLLPALRDRQRMLREQAAAVDNVVLAAEARDREQRPHSWKGHPTAAGDARRLRGIPAVSRDGIGGVSPGTHPEQETIRRMMRRVRIEDAA